MVHLIAIVGRPNVGKSTLFNRLVGSRKAIVHDKPGVTRDRHYAGTTMHGKKVILVDTGGFEPETTDSLKAKMKAQVELAVEEADLVLFVLDARDGLTPEDRNVTNMLRRSAKPVLYLANKVDSGKQRHDVLEFYELGVDRVIPISAEHNIGISGLEDAISKSLEVMRPAGRANGYNRPAAGEPRDNNDGSSEQESRKSPKNIAVAVVGFPNVGKSTLINHLLGEERLVAHDRPGTTIDPVDTELSWRGTDFLFIDTAGIKKRTKTIGLTEKVSAIKALKAIERADIAVLLVDVTRGTADQEARIARHAIDRGCGLVLALNKVDKLKKGVSLKKSEQAMLDKLRFASFAPVVSISGLTGKGMNKLLDNIKAVAKERLYRVTTAELNRFFAKVVEWHDPPLFRGRPVKIYYISQIGVGPPRFALVCNKPNGVSEQYKRYIVNSLRSAYGFKGSPIRIVARGRGKR
ncbi:MAG: ribosome biogenesis GTPase Der [Deltaproteobacteria bacterium]|nr:ribosome biogenesis GTPase Der [Deltaproteobacteria bacterium]